MKLLVAFCSAGLLVIIPLCAYADRGAVSVAARSFPMVHAPGITMQEKAAKNDADMVPPSTSAAQGRLDVLAPSQKLKLAEENEVALQIHAPGLTKVETNQVQYWPWETGPHKTPHFAQGGWAMVPVLYHADGSAYVNVIPRLLGQVVLKVVARFPDGGETQTEAVLTVGPPERSPDKLIVGSGGAPTMNARRMSIFLRPENRIYFLAVGAFYGNVKEQVQIDPAFASFEVRTANGTSIIELDKSLGSIKPLQLGETLVETSFGGWSNLTCVVVENDFDPNVRNFLDCKSLLLPGERLGVPIRR